MGIAAEVAPFWADLPERYAAAGIVVSRAGATTISELLCAGKPMVLLPYPHAADDHQRANAASLVQAGAAEVVEHAPDGAETARRLAAVLTPLLGDSERRQRLVRAARALARPKAAQTVVDLLLSVAGQ
jgi:UDP-N-acetylglucosamine--N-acetylmuramyl-(pentapeptide) pyrophosphoryl-undecaprenol N-acetylglucosamine transferase